MKQVRFARSGALLLLLCLSVGRTASADGHDTGKISGTEGGTRADAVKSNNAFGVEFYKRLRAAYPGKANLMVSPVSAFLALSMLYNGAEGTTKTAIAEVLAAQGVSVEDLNQANMELIGQLASKRDGVQVEIADSLFTNRGFTLKEDFAKKLGKAYQALIETKDFSDPDTVTYINNWVKGKTHEKIPKAVEKLDPGQKGLLLNAAYFKGEWLKPFPEKSTKPLDFTTVDGSREKPNTMSNVDRYHYAKGLGYEAIELPYGKNSSASMIVMLPEKGRTLQSFEKDLSAEQIEGIAKNLQKGPSQRGHVQLPKWKQSTDMGIRGVLSDMGMKEVFTGEAKLGKVSSTPLSISDAFQKTFIEVNEKSTEAAAITGIGLRSLSLPAVRFDMKMDRPFVYAIRDNDSGALLFLGSVTHPNAP